MSLNCVEIEEILKYFPGKSIIKNFFQIDNNCLIINCFNNNSEFNIFISVLDKYNRICLIPEDYFFEKKRSNFSQYLQSNLVNSTINNIYQYNYSRIIIFDLSYFNKNYKIICRLWGSAGNILLCNENNIIIESLKRFPKRNEWINEKFIFPVNNEKKDYSIRKEFITQKSINDTVFYYYNNLIENETIEKLKKELINFFSKEIETVNKKIEENNINLNSNKENEYLKIGELLKASIHHIKDLKTDSIILFDWETESNIEIKLDKNLSITDNIEKYFKKYKKIKDSKKLMIEQNILYNNKLNYLKEKLAIINNSSNIEELVNIKKSISKSKKNEENQKKIGRYFILSNDYEAYVSKSAKEADEILKKVACGNDYWFHIRDYEGSHIIVKNKKNIDIPEETKKEAALLALYFSKGKNSDEGDIYFTRVKYLHKPNTKTPGLVIPTQEKNIKIKKDLNLLEKILNKNI